MKVQENRHDVSCGLDLFEQETGWYDEKRLVRKSIAVSKTGSYFFDSHHLAFSVDSLTINSAGMVK
jgi:hypothetical protein